MQNLQAIFEHLELYAYSSLGLDTSDPDISEAITEAAHDAIRLAQNEDGDPVVIGRSILFHQFYPFDATLPKKGPQC